jgi:hypothetical protein
VGGKEEQESAGSGPGHPAEKGRGRLLTAYAIVALVALIVIAGIIALSSGSDSAPLGDPHINLKSGITNGTAPDSRPGIEPPEFEEQSLQKAALDAGCELRLRLPDEGHEHIPAGAPEPQYRTKPPTSGDHVDEQQADGAYRETPPPVGVVHSLEHGRLAIQYSLTLPERAQKELIDLYGTIYGGVILFPNGQMPYEVAATSWTNLLGCQHYKGAATLRAILSFGRATWGRYGGESVTALPPAAPTPTHPLAR